MLRSTTISITNAISSPAKFTNKDGPARWPSGASSQPTGRLALGVLRHPHTTWGYSDKAAARVEAAAERAMEIGARTYGSVKSILDNKLDRRPAPKRPADTAPILHPNIRGPRYYH
jgi:hypothetical protein